MVEGRMEEKKKFSGVGDQDRQEVVDVEGSNTPGDAEGDNEEKDQKQGPTLEQQEEMLKKKYGLLPKKSPLMQKEERSYWDSADWALNIGKGNKEGKKSSQGSSQASEHAEKSPAQGGALGQGGVLGHGGAQAQVGARGGGSSQPGVHRFKSSSETLRPKLQPTPHHHPVRRHSFADNIRFKP
eukprot:TRINITY_DN871_c1_g1_i1.p1 TRINITY_DN871_c1_g1~~TRINITY_DN871_c1_g1_i1.p1  ORF type:complete len:183 (-),score=42.19 TRINITY_DN871_c1_g1_i1:172-720(-)